MFNAPLAKESRLAQEIAPERIAAACGISLSTFFRYERGDAEPSFTAGMRWAAELDLEPKDLLADEHVATEAVA